MSFVPTSSPPAVPRLGGTGGHILLVGVDGQVSERIRAVAVAFDLEVRHSQRPDWAEIGRSCLVFVGDSAARATMAIGAAATCVLIATEDQWVPGESPAASGDGVDRPRGLESAAAGHWPGEVLPEHRSERLAELIAAAAQPVRASTLAVAGAVGGVGVTSFAVALAVRAGAQAPRVALVDADPASAGLDAVLGTESVGGLRWEAFAEVGATMAGLDLVSGLPIVGGVRVLTADAAGGGLEQVEVVARLAALRAVQSQFDQVVVDVGRGLELHLARQLCAVILLVRGDPPGVLAALRAVHRLSALRVRIAVLVRHAPGGLSNSQISTALGSSVTPLGAIPHSWRLARGAIEGELSSSITGKLTRVADRCLDWAA
ncbi:MAG: hypothetical protein ACK5MT_02705 [Actinomycetales bacterium]